MKVTNGNFPFDACNGTKLPCCHERNRGNEWELPVGCMQHKLQHCEGYEEGDQKYRTGGSRSMQATGSGSNGNRDGRKNYNEIAIKGTKVTNGKFPLDARNTRQLP